MVGMRAIWAVYQEEGGVLRCSGWWPACHTQGCPGVPNVASPHNVVVHICITHAMHTTHTPTNLLLSSTNLVRRPYMHKGCPKLCNSGMRHTHSYSLLGYVQIILLEASQPTPWLTAVVRRVTSVIFPSPMSCSFHECIHHRCVKGWGSEVQRPPLLVLLAGDQPTQTLPYFQNLSLVCRTMMPMWRMPSGIGSTPGTTAGAAQIIQKPHKISSSSGSVAWILCLLKPSRNTIGWRDSSMVSLRSPNSFHESSN